MKNKDLNLRIMDNVLHKLLICAVKAEEEKAAQCLHSFKECSDYLHYFITRGTPDHTGGQKHLNITPDYSLLAVTNYADRPNDFDTVDNALKLGALELTASIIVLLSMEINWRDRCGRAWCDSLITRLLIQKQFEQALS